MTEDDIKRSVLYHIANMDLNEEDGAGIDPTKGDDRPAEVTPEEYDEHLQKVIKINSGLRPMIFANISAPW